MADQRRIYVTHAERVKDPRMAYPKNYHPSAPAVIITEPTPQDFEALEAAYGHPEPHGLWEHWPERNIIVVWAEKLAVRSVQQALHAYGIALESGQVRHTFRKATFLRRNIQGEIVAQEEVDPTTIYQLLDKHGELPKPPHPAYMQKVFGVPMIYFTSNDLLVEPYQESKIDNGE